MEKFFYIILKEYWHYVKKVVDALIDLKNGDRGNLIVGASQTIGTYLMPRVLALFAQRLSSNKFKSSSEFNKT